MNLTRKVKSSGIHKITFRLNGKSIRTRISPGWSLLELLRDELGLTGTKEGCQSGDCGTCTVLLDGQPVYSCLLPAMKVENREVLTIEGLAKQGKLHPIQKAFLDHGAVQCGYCSPGMILSAKALLDRQPHPDQREIREALVGNLCRCGGYIQIIEAVEILAEQSGGFKGEAQLDKDPEE
jgi:carbon-monoxide dehydrogenase small subunit